MSKITIPSDLVKVNSIFARGGFSAYLVGGAVRDTLRKCPVHDWDLATNATPQQVMALFKRVIPTGIEHGTVTIHIFGHSIETTTFRTESDYADGRHPSSVSYAATIEDDLSRRDFTMNAIAAHLGTGELIDPFNGQDDIKRNIIRTVGSAHERFFEDGLRPVRAIRFAGQLGFHIERDTWNALSDPNVLEKVKGISVERFRDEWLKMLSFEKPSVCLQMLEETGILDIFIPEFKNCRGCSQKDVRGYHEFDVADHIFYACDGAPKDNSIVRLAAFYHDIGKPEARTVEKISIQGKDTEYIHFHRHEVFSAQKALLSLKRLKFSNEYIQKVTHLVREHMFFYEPVWSDAAVRRFLIRVGKENCKDLMALRLADIYGMHNCPVEANSATFKNLLELESRIEKMLLQNAALSIKDLAVNGNDLIALGIPAGKVLGALLKELFETVTDSPAMNEREKLLTLAKNLYEHKYQ